MHARSSTLTLLASLTLAPISPAATTPAIAPLAPATGSPDPTIIRAMPIVIDPEALQAAVADGQTLAIPLPDAPAIDAVFSHVQRSAPNALTALARPQNGATVFLAVHNDTLAADILTHAGTTYQIRTASDGTYAVRLMDQSQFMPCGTGDDHDLELAHAPHPFPRTASASALPASARSGACAEDGSFVDLLACYTDAAATAEGGTASMLALIDLALMETNQALADSNVATTIRLAGTVEVPKAWSTTSSATILNDMSDPTSGTLDQLHDLRDQYDADLVSLFVASLDVCGRAYLAVAPGPTPLPEYGFNVVAAACATGPTYALAHELAHNFGLNHDRADAPCDANATGFAHGYLEPSETFETLLGVSGTTAPRIPYLSNPNVLYSGMPTGVADDADNAASMIVAAPLVASFRSLDCNDNGICDTDEIAGGADDLDADGHLDECQPDLNNNAIVDAFDISSGASLDLDSNDIPDEAEPARIYVDPAASGTGLGDSWANARTDLQTALAIARRSPALVQEIWVAAGTYTPGPAPERARRFELPTGCAVYAGFAGTETDPAQRDWRANPTILSGDLDADDAPGFTNIDDNAISVLWASATDNTTLIDGFFIQGGNSDANTINCWFTPYSAGGGIRSFAGGTLVRNCVIRDNTSNNGGGLFVVSSNIPTFENCDFINNQALGDYSNSAGGAAYLNSNHEILCSFDRCRFIANHSDGAAGAVSALCQSGTFTNCLFHANTAWGYGALDLTGACTTANPSIINCTFTDNVSSVAVGGGIRCGKANPFVHNCVFWGNIDGGGAREAAQLYPSYEATQVMTHNTVQFWSGTLGDATNNGLDPLFTDPDGPDDVPGTLDDDLTLLSSSPAIDSGDNVALPTGITADLAGNPRRADDPDTPDTGAPAADAPYVDRGAYELQAPPPPACPGDIDGDNDTDVFDFGTFAANFGATGLTPFTNGDLDGDTDVDVFDFGILATDFGCSN